MPIQPTALPANILLFRIGKQIRLVDFGGSFNMKRVLSANMLIFIGNGKIGLLNLEFLILERVELVETYENLEGVK